MPETIATTDTDPKIGTLNGGSGGGEEDVKPNVDNASPSQSVNNSGKGQAHASPKKRRKVNHACVYCRRSHMTCDSERPCTRCIKRNIGHLCHDEPREPTKKNNRSDHEDSAVIGNEFTNSHNLADAGNQPMLSDSSLSIRPSTIDPSQAVQGNNQQVFGYNAGGSGGGDWAMNGQSNGYQDMHTFHPSYMFNAPEVTNEYNLLGDFLNNSLLDDNGMYGNEELQGLFSDSSLINMSTNINPNAASFAQQQQQQQQLAQLTPQQAANSQANAIQRPASSAVSTDKARENYYMTAADPSGMDPPEERMNKLLKAKYEAGMLRPFNYVKGYARLNQYMESHMQPSLRHKILRQLDKFRPKFRERMHSLTDIELVLSEMWFERSLMEYDRVFASMAIPACCWRRTGEIFRGNKEMAELINVPIENLRDGKLALHQIITEDQLVSYWEKFGAIAFDGSQKAMLTSCTLKSPDDDDSTKGIPCCFSFTIRRDPNAILDLSAMDADDETHHNENAISICAFAADIMSHLDDDNASSSAFLTWMQDADTRQTLNTTMEMLSLSTNRFSFRSLRLLDSSATALWNVSMRFLQRVAVGGIGGAIVQGSYQKCRDLSRFDTSRGSQMEMGYSFLVTGSSITVEVTDLLRRAALKVNSIDFSELADPDRQDYIARYHFLCAWMALKNEDIKDFDLHFSLLPRDVTKMSLGSREQEVLLMDEATLEVKDMSEAFNSRRSELLQSTEKDLEGPLGLFLQLEVASRQEAFDKDVYHQILIKYIKTMEPTKDKFKSDYLEAQAWCHFCQNKLFDRAIPKNKANVLRKTMDCSFQTGDYAEVKSAWELLDKEERDPTTIHIMYQVLLRDSDIDMAASLLVSLIELENGEHRYVIATVAAAVTVSSQLRRAALESAYTLIKKHPVVLKKKPINLDLHRLIVYELREDVGDVEYLREQMCEVLSWVKCAISQEPSDANDHDWFVRCTYMLLLESRDWAASHQLLILDVCFKLIDMYPKDVGIDVKHEMDRRQISCNLLGILIDTNMARAAKSTDIKTTYYLMVTHRHADIQRIIASYSNISDVTKYLDFTILERYHEILCFYLEAVIYLQQWPAVEAFIKAASSTNSDFARSIMVDMILTADTMPIEHVIRNLQASLPLLYLKHSTNFRQKELLNSLQHTDAKRLSFIRCIFDICLHQRRNDIRICETILNQALTTARDIASAENNRREDELEYLSAKSFNYAVDLYLSDQQVDAQRWARKAIELSTLMRNDYGRLALALQVKYEKWLTYRLESTDPSS
uniref:Regulator of drug sensitivity 2 n=1 Tax=Talaromyces marneffei PM1 TaxID=1077442 RepID=A0A093XNT4_TALMA